MKIAKQIKKNQQKNVKNSSVKQQNFMVGEPFVLGINKIEIFNASGLIVPYYQLTDGKDKTLVVGGVRLGRFEDYKKGEDYDWEKISTLIRNARCVINGMAFYEMECGEYECFSKLHPVVKTETFDKPLTLTLQEWQDWDSNNKKYVRKYELFSSPDFYYTRDDSIVVVCNGISLNAAKSFAEKDFNTQVIRNMYNFANGMYSEITKDINN